MASAKRTPRVSRISRSQTLAYARKQKSTAGGGDGSDEGDAAAADRAPGATSQPAIQPPASDAAIAAPPAIEPLSDAPAAPAIDASNTAPPAPPAPPAPEDAPEWHRARVETVSMPVQASIGAPPEMPASAVPASPVRSGAVEDPTHMPGPREIPAGHPDDLAAPPGRVPAGDSRSMRRRTDRYEFALVYRIQTYVISRVGVVGTRGQWRVVEYPTPTMASHAYAKECSRFVSDGFSDYRE